MSPTPISLSDAQLGAVLEGAATVPLDWRNCFLKNLADQLTGYEITDDRVRVAIACVLQNASRVKARGLSLRRTAAGRLAKRRVKMWRGANARLAI